MISCSIFSPIVSIELLIIATCAAVWAWAAGRLWHGQPVIAYQPRRPVPWQAIDLAVIVLVYLALEGGVFTLAGVCLGQDTSHGPPTAGNGGSTAEHVIGQLLAEGNVWVLLLCGVSAAVVAPVAEEFFFRVLLQGWLEALQHRWRRKMPTLHRIIPYGIGPIVLTSLLFASMHFRVEKPQIDVRFLMFILAGGGIARVLAILFAVCLLRWRVGATAADFGWATEKILHDIKLGLLAFVAVAVPIYVMQSCLRQVLPDCIAPDPIPLFFFAVALGALYYRTHRLMPLIVLHASLNGTSLLLAWLERLMQHV